MRGNRRFEFCKSGITIITEDADGEVYTIIARHMQDVINDWNGECNFLPANDARVFYAVHNGQIMALPEGCNLEMLIQLLQGGSSLRGECRRAV